VSPIRDRAWVQARLNEGATVVALAAAAGVSRQTASTWLRRHRLQVAPRRHVRPAPATLNQLYQAHGSVVAVATSLCVAPATAHRWLIDADVTLRPPGGPRQVRDAPLA
jgi:transposase-like protein